MGDIKYTVLVIGMGNILMADDGVGLHVVEELKKKEWSQGVLILEAGTSVINFVEEISQSRSVIAVDIVRAGGKPGTVYRFTPGDVLNWQDGWRDSHGFTLLQVIELARELTGLPDNLIIYGVEPQDLNFGNQLSLVIKESLPKLLDLVTLEIKMTKVNIGTFY